MKKLLVLLWLLAASLPVLAQKSVSVNMIPAPLFFRGKQDLMMDGNFEIGISGNSVIRTGIGLGFRNSSRYVENGSGTSAQTERYAAFCGILGWKYYPFSRTTAKNGFYGGLMVQLGFISLKDVTRNFPVTSGEETFYTFAKGGLIGGYSLHISERWLLEPELGYLPGKKFGVLSEREPLKNRLRLALNIGFRF